MSLPVRAIIRAVVLLALLQLSVVAAQAAQQVTVSIEGVEGDLLNNAQAALALPPGLIREGVVDRPWLEHVIGEAGDKVREALQPFGYYAPEVTTTLEQDGTDVFVVRVRVKPGEPVRLTGVTVDLRGPGAVEPLLREKVAAFPLKTGDRLLSQNYDAAKGELLAAAHGLGYLDAHFSVHEILVDQAATTARITLTMASGPRYHFGTVTVAGTNRYPEEFLRRYLEFSPGEPFSFEKLGKSQFNLVSSGLFRTVSVIPEKARAEGVAVPVEIRGTPAPGRIIRPGLGYGTDTGFRGSLNYRELNLLSPGNQLNVEATGAERFQGVGAAYSIPSPTRLDTVTTLQASLQREDVNDILSRLAALEANRTLGFGHSRLATAYLRFQFERYTVGMQDSDSRLLLPGLRFSERNYDDPVRPTAGYNYSAEIRGTHQSLGSDSGFVQIVMEGARLVALPARLSLAMRGTGGATLMDDQFATLPTSLRFYAGGDTSVRGYGYKSLGPADASGAVIGGRNLLQGSIELERSLFDSWGVSLFFDAGNAFNSFTDFRLYQGAGGGLHYYTRIGAVNLSLARQIGVSDPQWRVHLTIGFQM